MAEADLHCRRGLGIWDWASTDMRTEPDVVLACAHDVPTMEALAPAGILHQRRPDLKVRFVNVVDRVPGLAATAAHLRQEMIDEREQCREYTRVHGEDDPRVAEWRWSPIER
jgi:phosphoketolase